MPATFNQILILDSIPAGELNTAVRLYEAVAAIARDIDEAPAVVPLRIDSWGHFQHVIGQCTELARRDPYVPLLHLECHGSQEVLQFADGSQASWTEIKEALTPLNIATRLNLVAVISACDGSALAGAVRVTERAPVWGLIGPNRKMFASDLETAFIAFYETYLRTESSEEAADAMRATDCEGTFMVMSSEAIYRIVLAAYRANYGSREVCLERARNMLAQAQEQGIELPQSAEEIAEMMERLDPEIIEEYRRKFFMIDLYPEHAERFMPPVTLPALGSELDGGAA